MTSCTPVRGNHCCRFHRSVVRHPLQLSRANSDTPSRRKPTGTRHAQRARVLEALPVPAEVVQAAVQQEGLRRRPAGLSAPGRRRAALRGVLLACAVVLAKAGAAGEEAVAGVRRVLRHTWRASSPVECLNSVLRMQQARHRKLSQGLLDLKRLYWDCHTFRTGGRRSSEFLTFYVVQGQSLARTGPGSASPAAVGKKLLSPRRAAARYDRNGQAAGFAGPLRLPAAFSHEPRAPRMTPSPLANGRNGRRAGPPAPSANRDNGGHGPPSPFRPRLRRGIVTEASSLDPPPGAPHAGRTPVPGCRPPPPGG